MNQMIVEWHVTMEIQHCEVYFMHDGLFCPCCRMRLRPSPVNKRIGTD